jgi:hypothetical protein
MEVQQTESLNIDHVGNLKRKERTYLQTGTQLKLQGSTTHSRQYRPLDPDI